jgi:2-polyprenyl-3-methyl-5-hydroxy-6-metoxy-1,4-benzoquinol methylase
MTQLAADAKEIISAIMSRYGARCTPEEFHAAVNVTFHNFESQVYDEIHSDMWASLPQEFALLVDDCLRECPNAPAKMRLLDIGAGTGLASDCLLRTAIGPRIASIDLLDTSPSMLQQATLRSARWNIPARSRLGLINDIPHGELYELIVTCSVLHHVPDLQAFCTLVRRHQAPGGIVLHMQDPNADFLEKNPPPSTSKRRILEQLARFTPRRIWGRVARELTGKQGEDYISKTNRALVDAAVIARPLKVEDLFAITDIHVISGHGISLQTMRQWLPEYACISQRSYSFFGKLWSNLPADLRHEEERLATKNDLSGAHTAAAWLLKAPTGQA